MTLVRHHNWRSLLTRYMIEATQKEFAWGSFDCGHNIADAILLMTGVDFAAQFRGQYSDEAGGDAALRRAGYSDMLDCVRQNLPMADSPWSAHTGDVAAFLHGEHQIVGLVYQTRIFSPSPGLRGMGSVNLRRAHTVFKVGEA